MKQIIKTIWKSNEIPYDGNFLWLKREDGEFRLYTMGQKGWERLFKLQESPTTDSELNFIGTYTKSDFRNFTAEQWKEFLNQNFTFPMEDKNYFLKLGTTDLQDTITLSFKDGRVVVYFPEPTDALFEGFNYTTSGNKVNSVGTITSVSFESLVSGIVNNNQSIMFKSDLSITKVLVYDIEPYEQFVGSMFFGTDAQGFQDWFDGHYSNWEELENTPTLLIFEGDDGIDATAYTVYDTIHEEVQINFTFSAYQVPVLQNSVTYNVIPKHIKYRVEVDQEYNHHEVYHISSSLFDCNFGYVIEKNSIGTFYGGILRSGYTVAQLSAFLELVYNKQDYSENNVYKYLVRLETLVDWNAYKTIHISFDNRVLRAIQLVSGRMRLDFIDGEGISLSSETICSFKILEYGDVSLYEKSKMLYEHTWEISSLISTIKNQNQSNYTTWKDNLQGLGGIFGWGHDKLIECKDGNMYIDKSGNIFTIYFYRFFEEQGPNIYYGCSFSTEGISYCHLKKIISEEAISELYLPLTAGSDHALTGALYTKEIRPTTNGIAFGVKNENYKYTPYIYPPRILQETGRWEIKRVFSYSGAEETFSVKGIIDIEVPKVPSIKYRITLNDGYTSSKIIEIQAFMLFTQTTPYHIFGSGTSIQYGTSTITVRRATKADGTNHLLIGATSAIYAPLFCIEVEAITTTTGQTDVDAVFATLSPTFVEDETIYNNIYVF